MLKCLTHKVARLQKIKNHQQETRTAETPDQRVTRLQQMRDRRQETCATETLDQRDIRLQIDRQGHQQTRIVESPDQTASHALWRCLHAAHASKLFLDSLCPLSLMSADGATVTSLTPLSCSPMGTTWILALHVQLQLQVCM